MNARLEHVEQRLDAIVKRSRHRQDRLGFFPALYRSVTLIVGQRLREGFFTDPAWTEHLVTVFAERYFVALDAWESRRAGPRSWRVAFAAAERIEPCVLQHLLLGMNAHINFDLGPAAVAVSDRSSLAGHYGDFQRVNTVLMSLLPAAQAALGQVSPMLDILDRLAIQTDEAVAGFSLKVARAEAWATAEELQNSRDPNSFLDRLDRRVAVLGATIATPGLPFGPAFQVVRAVERANPVDPVLDLLTGLRPS